MKKAFVSVGACFCALLGMLTACTQPAPTSQESGYKTMTVKKENRLLTNSYSAVVKGRQSVEIRPQVSGTITEICVKEGAKVHKGQVLFVIDQVPYKAALQTALANVKSAEAAVATARLTFDSKEELFKERVVSDFDHKVNESGKAELAQVTVFPLNNGQEYIVESGLQEGEVIVAEGAGLIQENTQILSLHTEK